MFQIRCPDPAIENPVKGELTTDIDRSRKRLIHGSVVQHPGAGIIVLHLDQQVPFEVCLACVLDLRLVPVRDHKLRLIIPALFIGVDRDVLIAGRGVTVDVPAAPETQLRQPGPVQPAFSITVQVNSVESVDKPAGVQGAAVPRVMVFIVIRGLHGDVRVGRLSVLNSDLEIGSGEITGFVEAQSRVINVRVRRKTGGVEEEESPVNVVRG